MAKEIDVLFIEEKKGSFQLGQQKRVKAGYARNYLLPQGFAVLVNSENLTKMDSIKRKAGKRQVELKKDATAIQKVLDKQSVSFVVKTHDEGRLYGSISVNELVEMINKTHKTTLDKYDIKGYTSIKETGSYTISVSIHKDVSIGMTVVVDAEPEKPSKQRRRLKAAEKKVEEDVAEALPADVTEPVTDTPDVEKEEKVKEDVAEALPADVTEPVTDAPEEKKEKKAAPKKKAAKKKEKAETPADETDASDEKPSDDA